MDADVGLEGVGVEIDARENLGLLQNPFPDIAETRRAENTVGQDDGAPPAGAQKPDATLDEEDFGRLRFPTVPACLIQRSVALS